MPTGRQQGRYAPTENVIFADITLTEAAKKDLQKNEGFQANVFIELNAIIARGYRVVVKADTRLEGAIATAQNVSEEASDGNVIYVVRSRYGGKALAQLIYSYAVVGNGEFPYNAGGDDSDADETPW